MKTVQKLLWGEGLFLKPQHFQYQDLYHEQRLAAGLRQAHPYLWGVGALKLDRDALEGGVLRLHEVSALLPDGERVNAPESDALPEGRRLSDIDIPAEGLCFYLALPVLRQGMSNYCAPETESRSARYVHHSEPAADLYTRAVEGELAVLRKNLRLVSENEPRESFMSIPLARIRKTATGGYETDPAFMPPATSIAAIPTLGMLLRRLLDMLQAKCEALYGHHREPSKHIIEFRSGDVASFWLLHTASAAFAELSHLLHHPRLHPERLFQQLLGLAGQLLTFSKAYSLADLPVYTHEDPGPGFLRLDSMIRDLIDTVISARYVAIALQEQKPGHHVGRIESDKLQAGASFFIAVSADMPPAELVESVPVRLKVGAPDDVEKLVLSAMPGARISTAPQVPAAIPVRPGAYYFAVEPHGAIYERMMQAQTMAIYVPAGFKDLKLELMAVME
ncbi:type VI secretion system baseplate subunit TssK [Niveibacterium sp. SC-1]|uniref:type VI secretion system baseplate subunit TssK n=1 Tax=Niveibacterium sp. SC-1 TaxID=3135646 RepID=UPI0031200CA2